METTSFFRAITWRFFSNQQHSDTKGTRRTRMATWHRKLMRGVVALDLGVTIFGVGTLAHAFDGRHIKPENIVGINILANETNFIVNLSLCGGTQGTYLHVQTNDPLHDRVFAAWNLAVLNGNGMDVWGNCRDTVHADLTVFGVDQ